MTDKVARDAVKIVVDHNGTIYSAEYGRISETHLGLEDHGMFSLALTFDFGGRVQGVGHFQLDSYKRDKNDIGYRVPTLSGLDLLTKIVEVAGCQVWERVNGVHLYALRQGNRGSILGILNPSSGKILIFQELYDSWKDKDGTVM